MGTPAQDGVNTHSKPLVSIITIFLNAEEFLQEAIESILCQTYDRWELLLVDDGSIDGSTAIARSYAEQYPQKVRYLEHQNHCNLGKSSSRNLGIRKARGTYLAFLDADDVFLPWKLEHQVAILESESQAAMVYGRTQYWYSWTGKSRDRRRDFTRKLGVEPGKLFDPPTLLIHFLRNGKTVPCICGLLVRRQVVLDVGEFDESLQHLFEDQTLLAKICLLSPVFVESGCWERYRQHTGSSSYLAIKSGEYHPWRSNRSHLAYLSWLAGYINEQGTRDTELKKALDKKLWLYRHPILNHVIGPVQLAVNIVRDCLEGAPQGS